MRAMTTPMKAGWWLTLLITLAVWLYGFVRLHIHAWTSGAILVAVAAVLAVGLRLTCDDVLGVRTGS